MIYNKLNFCYLACIIIVLSGVLGAREANAQNPETHFINATAAWGIADCNDLYGITVTDYDLDHDDDLYIGCHLRPPLFYQNQLSKSFKDVTAGLNLNVIDSFYVDRHSAAFADFDGDGDKDMFLVTGSINGSCCGYDQFYENQTDKWVERGQELNIRDDDGSGRYGFWFDYNNDKLLDLFVGHVVYPESPQKNKHLVYSNPTWQNVASSLGLDNLDNTGAGIAVDLDLDSDADLVLTPKYARPGGEPDDSLAIYLNHFSSTGSFKKTKCAASSEFVTVVAADLDNDLDEDLVFGQLNGNLQIWENPGNPLIEPCNWSKRTIFNKARNATSIIAADFNNDGMQDLYIGKENPIGQNPAVVLLGTSNTFMEDTLSGVAVWDTSSEIQASWGDFNNDGWIDIIAGANKSGEKPHAALLMNNYQKDYSQNKYLVLRLHDQSPNSKNRDMIGARVRVQSGTKTQMKSVHSGAAWHAIFPSYLHFGLGEEPTSQVTLEYNASERATFNNLKSNQCWELFYPSGIAQPCKTATSVKNFSIADRFKNLKFPNPIVRGQIISIPDLQNEITELHWINHLGVITWKSSRTMSGIFQIPTDQSGLFVAVAYFKSGETVSIKVVVQ